MRLQDYMAAIIADLKANTMGPQGFLKDIDTHSKTFGVEELKQIVVVAPAVRIGIVGSRGGSAAMGRRGAGSGMYRADTGQFTGPLQMIAFLIEQDYGAQEARDRVIMLVDEFMYYIEHKQWGLGDQVGPALVTGFEIFYTAELDAQGAAIGAVSWEQEVHFGRSLHDEDMALLQESGHPEYVPDFRPSPLYPEKEWADKGVLDVDKPPLGHGKATGQFVHDKTDDPETPTDETASPPEKEYKELDVEE